MQQRGSPRISAAVSRDTHPLVSLPPVSSAFHLKVVWYGPTGARPMFEPKRFKVSATIQIDGELTAEELREIFLPAERLGGRVAISAHTPERVQPEEPQEETDEEAYKRHLSERAREITQAYRDKLGEPPEQLLPALGMWIPEFSEPILRRAITETAMAAIKGQQAQYEYLRDWLRKHRSALRRER